MSSEIIENIKTRIFSKEKNKEYDPLEDWHYFMLHYGYIPFDDFISMDAGIKERLIALLNEYNKKMNKSIGGKK